MTESSSPQGNGIVELSSKSAVNDGRWHELLARFNPSYMEISVDGANETLRPSPGESQHLDLNGLLYFGGVDPSKRSRALSQGVAGASEALEGCIRDLELDGRKIGLPSVKETSGILAGCEWAFPCLEERGVSCHYPEGCVQKGTSGYECVCQNGESCKDDDARREGVVPTAGGDGKQELEVSEISYGNLFVILIIARSCEREGILARSR